MTDFLRVLKVARRHAPWLVLAVLSMVLVSAATVFAYNLIRPIYDELLDPTAEVAERVASTGAMVGWLDQLADRATEWLRARLESHRGSLLLLLLLAIVAKNGFGFLARYAGARLGLATVRDLRNMIFDALLGQSPGYFHRSSTGVLVSRVVNDVQLVNEAVAERLGDLLQDVLILIVLVAYLYSLDLRLALATTVVAPLLLAPVVYLSRRLRRRSREAQERMAELATALDETVRGIRIVQAFDGQHFKRERFRSASERHFRSSLKARAIQAANAPIMELVGTAAAAALIAYASIQIAEGLMTLGDFSAFLIATYGAYNPIKRLNKFNLALQQAVVASERVYDVIDAPVAVQDRPGSIRLEGIGDGIRFDNVSFAYEHDRWVLRDFDLEVPVGRRVAVVGPSGAGKTTVAQLIPRFWDVQRGVVTIDGHDVREVRLASLRAQIGLVTQETVLFADSVRANIAFGRDRASEEEVEAAARAARAHGFVRALPEGYDTLIGEGGARLSGGQRQRLAIARALLRDAPVLILDEATSALDPPEERLIQKALDELMRGRTTLIIAHRLSTVRKADTIVVMDEGRVVQMGTHDELIAADGLYRKLVEADEITD
jgi:subfamily B ATP-binding cassette protein MsbA